MSLEHDDAVPHDNERVQGKVVLLDETQGARAAQSHDL